ncbi:MAG: hypothetical protein A2W19_12575 [Spirochaetes bacterium RBG_16_49_21]|nr:MAG: hypothetical protein A2W19_12575 [Spirochaetes bacterium RBG_16_49_21]
MSRFRWYFILALALVIASLAVYVVQIIVFHKTEDTLFYLLQDLAFVPVQVLLVMLIIDRLLQKKEKEALLNKLNMIIGVFFNEVGTGLISLFIETEKNLPVLRSEMMIDKEWDTKKFTVCGRFLAGFNPEVALTREVLTKMKTFLLEHRDAMLRMLENPNLLEHDKFTDLLWAVFHLADELHHRVSFEKLPPNDLSHLAGDVNRAYKLIMFEWLEYMKHLKMIYPYLFSIAVRKNPFNPDAKIEVV